MQSVIHSYVLYDYCKAAGVNVLKHCCILTVQLDQQYCVRIPRYKQRCKYDPNEKEQTDRCRKERVSRQETVTGSLQHNRVRTHTCVYVCTHHIRVKHKYKHKRTGALTTIITNKHQSICVNSSLL